MLLYLALLNISNAINIQSSGDCVDKSLFCGFAASNGECEKQPAYMKRNCKKSCNLCDESCLDKSHHCQNWADARKCEKNPGYMRAKCKKSCGWCH